MGNIFAKLDSEKGIFKNEDALLPDYLPEDILHREIQIKELAYSIGPAAKGKKPQNAIAVGPPGSGKTCCCKHVIRQLEEFSGKAMPIYINCWEYSTRHAVLSKIAEALGQAMPRRGIATDEIVSRIAEVLKNEQKILIVVLDEIDRLAAAGEQKVLYDLTRAQENFSAKIGVIGVTNDEELMSKLDSRIRSSIGSASIRFRSYTPEEIKDILNERAKLAFHSGVLDKDVIPICAAWAAKNGGDARMAIECMRRAGRLAEDSGNAKISKEHVQKILPDAEKARHIDVVSSLSENERKIVTLLSENGEMTSGQIEEHFEKTSGETDRSVRNYITRLEKLGIISCKELEGARGRSRVCSLR